VAVKWNLPWEAYKTDLVMIVMITNNIKISNNTVIISSYARGQRKRSILILSHDAAFVEFRGCWPVEQKHAKLMPYAKRNHFLETFGSRNFGGGIGNDEKNI